MSESDLFYVWKNSILISGMEEWKTRTNMYITADLSFIYTRVETTRRNQLSFDYTNTQKLQAGSSKLPTFDLKLTKDKA